MRILYLSRGYATHDRRFLETIASAGHEALFARLDKGHVGDERELPAAVRQVDLEPGSAVNTPDAARAAVPVFRRLVARERPDIVQAGPMPTGAYLAALAGAEPLVSMSWGSDVLADAERDADWRGAAVEAIRHSELVVCDSRVVEEKLRALADPDRPRVVRFPWGIDLGAFSPGESALPLRRRIEWRGALVVLSTRTWAPEYGTMTLLEAFRQAREREDRLRLLLLGTGILAAEVDAYVRAHGLLDVVERPGLVRYGDLPDVFRAADVYISCSTSDGTSVSLLEALATGLPAVVSDIAGNREWVRSGENGWLAPPGDAAAFAGALLAATRLGPAERSRIAQRNRKVAEARADWTAGSRRLMAAYEEIGRRGAGRHP